jgi:hypothetical protein
LRVLIFWLHRPALVRCSTLQESGHRQQAYATLFELATLLLIAVSLGVWATIVGVRRPTGFSFAAPVLAFGGLLLFSIYLLDRFYYSSLLIGTVNRLEALESGPLHGVVGLSQSITRAAPVWTYTILPAALYLLPVLVLLNVGLGIAAYGSVHNTGGIANLVNAWRMQ